MDTHRHSREDGKASLGTRRARGWLGALALVLGCGVAGYLLGFPPRSTVRRMAEAAGDLAAPAATAIRRREGGERLRAELVRFLEVQEWFFRENGRIRQPAEVLREDTGYVVEYRADPSGAWWFAWIRRADGGANGVLCAVTMGRVPAYVAGIHLRRSGQVRCSNDLANRMNRLWSRVVPFDAGK